MATSQRPVGGRWLAKAAKVLCSLTLFLAVGLGLLAACVTPPTFSALEPEIPVQPKFDVENSRFISFDGAELGLTVWEPEDKNKDPQIVIVGLHGMNDYANAFHLAAPYLTERGVKIYAYDHRGFGRSVGRGDWPDEELMREDLRVAVKLAREAHPEATLAVVGISMGGAVTMSAFGSDRPPEGVDRVILSGPGLRGWGAIPFYQRAALWTSVRVNPGWTLRPPRKLLKRMKIKPSDNMEMLQRHWVDPLPLKSNKVTQVNGVVNVMESAHKAAPNLPSDVPTLLTYGANDMVIPKPGMKRTLKVLPEHVRTVYYPEGYHMLLRDLQRERVFEDMMAFLKDPDADLPSGLGAIELND